MLSNSSKLNAATYLLPSTFLSSMTSLGLLSFFSVFLGLFVDDSETKKKMKHTRKKGKNVIAQAPEG